MEKYKIEKLFKMADEVSKNAVNMDEPQTVGDFIENALSIQMGKVLYALGLSSEFEEWQKAHA